MGRGVQKRSVCIVLQWVAGVVLTSTDYRLLDWLPTNKKSLASSEQLHPHRHGRSARVAHLGRSRGTLGAEQVAARDYSRVGASVHTYRAFRTHALRRLR